MMTPSLLWSADLKAHRFGGLPCCNHKSRVSGKGMTNIKATPRSLSCQLIDWWWGKRMAENFGNRDTYQICDSSFCLNIIPSACHSSCFFRFWRILGLNHSFFNHFKTAIVQKLRDIQSRRTCFTASSHLIAERRVTASLGLISDFCGSFLAQILFSRTRDNFEEINVRPKRIWLHFTLGWY